MKQPVTIKVSVTVYTDKKPEQVAGAISKGIYRELDMARIAAPINVKIETE